MGPGHRRPGLEHGLSRRDRRQRGPTRHTGRDGHRRGPCAVDHRGVLAPAGVARARRRCPRGSLRAKTHFRARCPAFRGRICRLRLRAGRDVAHRGSRGARSRRGASRAGQPCAHQRGLRRAASGQSHRNMVRVQRGDRSGRAGRGGVDRRARVLALAFLLQRAAGHARCGARPVGCGGDARRVCTPAHRLGGCRARDRGARTGDVRARRLGARARDDATARAARRRRGDSRRVHDRRDEEPRADGTALALPLAHLHRYEPLDTSALRGARWGVVLPALQSDPGARVLTRGGGRCVASAHIAHFGDEPLVRAAWRCAWARCRC